jgi:putative lipoic acid-binding regulatory protein
VKNDQEYDNLRSKLNKNGNWPLLYMFKFIIPADNQKLALVRSKFSDQSVITQKESSNGKYISITVREVMLDADSIIEKYKEMGDIEGLMSF